MVEGFVTDIAPQDPTPWADEKGAVHRTFLEVVKGVIVPEGPKPGIREDGEGEGPAGFRRLFPGFAQSQSEGFHVVGADGDHLDARLPVVRQSGAEFLKLAEAEGTAYSQEEVQENRFALVVGESYGVAGVIG